MTFVFAFAHIARADETIVIEGHAPDAPARDRERLLGDAPFITIIHADDHSATSSVADAVGQTVGAQTRSLGGLGAFESISIRGAAPGHTEVLIDGIPLARLAQVTTDLGKFSLASFGEVELYRGAVPVELGGAGVGGALNLLTRLGRGDRGETITASTGAGSFGARHARVHYGDAYGDWLTSVTAGYQGARGDFTYYDNNGTLLNATDDNARAVRRNDGFDQVDAAARAGSGTTAAGLRAAWKQQGLPGSIAQPAIAANLTTLDLIGDARAELASTRELGYVLVETQELRDPLAELGLGSQRRGFLTLSGGASSTWRGGGATAGVELRADRFRDRDLAGMQPTATGDRAGGALLAAYDAVLDPTVIVTPAVRLDILRTAPTPEILQTMAAAPRWDVVPSPRVTMRLLATPDLALKASGGWYVRLPTLVELFGDRGYLLGDPSLRPERGPSADLGGVWAPAAAIGPIDRVLVEADVFATRARDTIAFITTAGFTARAANIGQSQTSGAELVLAARAWRTLSVTASYTKLQSEQISADPMLNGRPLPRTPEDLLYARADVVRGRASGWLDVAAQSESFLDNAGLGVVPGRALVGAGARVAIAAKLGVAVQVSNAFDVRVAQLPLVPPPSPSFTSAPVALTDVAGYPLPGRAFYVSMDWSH